jgi:hypothetical protein
MTLFYLLKADLATLTGCVLESLAPLPVDVTLYIFNASTPPQILQAYCKPPIASTDGEPNNFLFALSHGLVHARERDFVGCVDMPADPGPHRQS